MWNPSIDELLQAHPVHTMPEGGREPTEVFGGILFRREWLNTFKESIFEYFCMDLKKQIVENFLVCWYRLGPID